ncbi:MAG: type IV secretion system DNA-binding domain-containing protein [bacterium]|nr:type IV secretion system DNA-binding domain-containing protein [bacterium]
MESDTAYFAKTNFRGTDKMFGIMKHDRRQHMYVIGKTGTGKSVLMKNMAIQDIKNGHGLAIIDPHGEFVEEVLASIPPERADDVIYFNPADHDFAIGFNVLEVTDPRYKHLVASGLMGIFTKIWANVWSSRMEYILNNCILALIDTPGSTLLSIPRLLVDKEYRENIVANVTDPVVKSFWIHEYSAYNERFRSEAIAPIQNKVGQFLSTPLIRNIVGQSKSTIDIDKVMNEGKILLVNVSKGRIGEDNSALLGAMIITKIQLAAMERVKVSEDQRKDFFLYVDEFQNFATESFASILSEARKYRLNLIIAHQYTGQLVTDQSTAVRDAVFGNCGTMIVFRVGAADAELLEPEFEPEFLIQDIVSLPNYHIYTKLMVNGVTSRPFSATTLAPIQVDRSPEIVDVIIENCRKNYSRPRVDAESEINNWASQGGSPSSDKFSSSGPPRRAFQERESSAPRRFEPAPVQPPRPASRPVSPAPPAGHALSGNLGNQNIELNESSPRPDSHGNALPVGMDWRPPPGREKPSAPTQSSSPSKGLSSAPSPKGSPPDFRPHSKNFVLPGGAEKQESRSPVRPALNTSAKTPMRKEGLPGTLAPKGLPGTHPPQGE